MISFGGILGCCMASTSGLGAMQLAAPQITPADSRGRASIVSK